jgi:hypothetical protein
MDAQQHAADMEIMKSRQESQMQSLKGQIADVQDRLAASSKRERENAGRSAGDNSLIIQKDAEVRGGHTTRNRFYYFSIVVAQPTIPDTSQHITY